MSFWHYGIFLILLESFIGGGSLAVPKLEVGIDDSDLLKKLSQVSDQNLNFKKEFLFRNESRGTHDKVFNSCGCAKSTFAINSEERIVGGNVAQPHSLPYQVLVRISGTGICGGTILNPRYVLTAHHCISSITDRSNPDVIVFAGLHDVCGTTADDGIQKRRAQRIIVVADGEFSFIEDSMENDFALIELSEPFKFDRTVQPACLPQTDVLPGQMTWTSGWGRLTSGGQRPCQLNYVDQIVVSDSDCQNSPIGQKFGPLNLNAMLCAGGYHYIGKDACQGDSGGPLARVTESGLIEVVGIVSWGLGCGEPDYPGMYTRVFTYVQWIIDQIQDGECALADWPDVEGHNPYSWTPIPDQATAKPCSHYFIGDGICDDFCNNVIYSYDGGDCCEPHLKSSWNNTCTKCACLNPSSSTAEAATAEAAIATTNDYSDINP